jgi:hypothetical protein
MYVVRLNDDFTGPETPVVENQTWARTLVRHMREGAAPFKFNGRYYLITSACTGWTPNAADCAVADNILGPYKSRGNPASGKARKEPSKLRARSSCPCRSGRGNLFSSRTNGIRRTCRTRVTFGCR